MSINWERIVESISEKNIIPIVGNEVYQFNKELLITNGQDLKSAQLNNGKATAELPPHAFEDKGIEPAKVANKPVKVDEHLAQSLIRKYGIQEEDSSITLAEVVFKLSKNHNKGLGDIMLSLKSTLKNVNFDYPLLTSLLTIDKLNFFVNTTIYNILEKKIKDSRNVDAVSLNFSINSRMRNAHIDIANSDRPVVFNFFGSLFNSPDPALTEEEMLEYTTLFISRMAEGADEILDELKNKSILFLGCSQPEWLIRFFLRVLVNERMNDWDRRRSTITIVSDQMNMNQRQYAFLKSHKVEIFDGNTSEFVGTLVDKWMQVNIPARKPKLIFLSYTQADTDVVQRIKQEIENRVDGVSCWYDKERIFSGDKFTSVIVDNIRKSHLFIPLISQNCVNKPDKYFSREWEWAYNQNIIRELDGIDKKFIMPIVIDDTLATEEIVAKFFNDVSIERVPEGKPDDNFINRLKETLKD